MQGGCLHQPTNGTLCNWQKHKRNFFRGCWVIASISRKLRDLAFKSACLETRPGKSIINHTPTASHLQRGHHEIDGTLDTNCLILGSLRTVDQPLHGLRSQPCFWDRASPSHNLPLNNNYFVTSNGKHVSRPGCEEVWEVCSAVLPRSWTPL